MFARTKTQRLTAGLVAAVVAAVVGGLVIASASSSTVVVCSAKGSGALRYSKSGDCKPNETRLELNEDGKAGATGATGATGARGATGTYPSSMQIRDITSTHTLVASDQGKILVSRSGSVVTVPANATVAFDVGARIDFGVVSSFLYLDPASGVTVNAGTSRVELDTGTFQIATLVKIATNEWVLLKTVDEN